MCNSHSDEADLLEAALNKQAADNPLDEVKQIRKAQLDQCAIRRSEEIEQMLNPQSNDAEDDKAWSF